MFQFLELSTTKSQFGVRKRSACSVLGRWEASVPVFRKALHALLGKGRPFGAALGPSDAFGEFVSPLA